MNNLYAYYEINANGTYTVEFYVNGQYDGFLITGGNFDMLYAECERRARTRVQPTTLQAVIKGLPKV